MGTSIVEKSGKPNRDQKGGFLKWLGGGVMTLVVGGTAPWWAPSCEPVAAPKVSYKLVWWNHYSGTLSEVVRSESRDDVDNDAYARNTVPFKLGAEHIVSITQIAGDEEFKGDGMKIFGAPYNLPYVSRGLLRKQDDECWFLLEVQSDEQIRTNGIIPRRPTSDNFHCGHQTNLPQG